MPRPEKPLDPDSGPIAAFAARLRELRADAGTPSYRTMQARCFYGFTTLAEAAAGQRFPSWEVTCAFVTACGGEVQEWERLWRETADLLKDDHGDEDGERSPPDIASSATEDRLRRVLSSVPTAPEPQLRPERTAPSSVLARLQLGARLRELRERARIARTDAGYAIRGSDSKISRMELGRVGFKIRDVNDLLRLYGADADECATILELVEQSNTPDWWQAYSDLLPGHFETYLGLEDAASMLRTYEVKFVPDLLQTKEYAKAVTRLRHPQARWPEINRRVALHMRRQERLTQEPSPMRLWAVIDEAALRRPIGDRAVLRHQIEHLITMADLPTVTLQILPSDAEGRAMSSGPFSVLRFPASFMPDVVYVELLTTALCLDKLPDIDVYQQELNALTVDAMSPEMTVDLLERALRPAPSANPAIPFAHAL